MLCNAHKKFIQTEINDHKTTLDYAFDVMNFEWLHSFSWIYSRTSKWTPSKMTWFGTTKKLHLVYKINYVHLLKQDVSIFYPFPPLSAIFITLVWVEQWYSSFPRFPFHTCLHFSVFASVSLVWPQLHQ